MVELFQDVSRQVKDRTRFWVNIALLNPNPREGAQQVLDYRNSLKNEREKEFVDFLVKLANLEEEQDK